MNAGLQSDKPFRRLPTKGKRARTRACQIWLVLMAVLLGPSLAWADEPNRAGLVVQFADGQTETLCVEFREKEITGADLLVRSGLEAIVDPSSGLGIIVCRIEGQGCDYPAEACFCQCSGSGPCAYWNYFYREPGQDSWTYAALGALRHQVRSGSVDAWVWGDGTILPAADLTFEAICPSLAPTATQPATGITQEPVQPAATTTDAPTLQPTKAQPAETLAPAATPSPVSSGQGTSGYWMFGGLILILAAAGFVVWLRSRR